MFSTEKINYSNNVELLISKVHKDPTWHSHMDENEAEAILKDFPAYSYLLRAGENEIHYFLSCVLKDGEVFHKSIRINLIKEGYYLNGNGADKLGGCNPNIVFQEVEQFVCKLLSCEKGDLLPLPNYVCKAQGF